MGLRSHQARQGLLVRDTDQSYLIADAVDADNETPMNHLLGSSITYRIAVGQAPPATGLFD